MFIYNNPLKSLISFQCFAALYEKTINVFRVGTCDDKCIYKVWFTTPYQYIFIEEKNNGEVSYSWQYQHMGYRFKNVRNNPFNTADQQLVNKILYKIYHNLCIEAAIMLGIVIKHNDYPKTKTIAKGDVVSIPQNEFLEDHTYVHNMVKRERGLFLILSEGKFHCNIKDKCPTDSLVVEYNQYELSGGFIDYVNSTMMDAMLTANVDSSDFFHKVLFLLIAGDIQYLPIMEDNVFNDMLNCLAKPESHVSAKIKTVYVNCISAIKADIRSILKANSSIKDPNDLIINKINKLIKNRKKPYCEYSTLLGVQH